MKKDFDLLKLARERMSEAYEADLPNRDRDLDDRRFAIGEQWPEEVRRTRETEGKPCLTINGLPQYLRQVTAQIRGLNPAIKVNPADGDTSEDTAEIYEGLIRDIEKASDASNVYEQAAESAATGGIGYFRARTDYCDYNTFDQKILIESIENPFAVFIDPQAKHSTRKDARYVFIADEMHLEDFTAAYPDANVTDFTSDNRPSGYEQWVRGENVVVAEYYWIEHDEYEIGLLETGEVVRDPKPPLMFTKKRKVKEPRVKWAKLSADDVLEGPLDIPGHRIPVFAVTGEEIHVGEETYRSGVIRFAKDPQQLYNYARSAQAEIIALQPKMPYIGTVKQFAGFESLWANANNANNAYIPYNPDEKAPGAPKREMPPVASQGWMAEIQLAAEDMKRTTGIYDAALGAKSNETSGVAINARQQESQAATSVYADNMVKAVVQCGKVIVDMIPHVYDTRRVISILGPEDDEKMVVINEIMQTLEGPIAINDMTAGKYKVSVSVGPAYATLKQEARDGMMEFLRVVPQAGQVTADLVASAQDWPMKDQFAERLLKVLPPGIAEDEGEGQDGQQIQQAVEAQLQELIPQITQKLEQDIIGSAAARKADAEAREAEAEADEAEAEAKEAHIRLVAMMNGQIPAQQGL